MFLDSCLALATAIDELLYLLYLSNADCTTLINTVETSGRKRMRDSAKHRLEELLVRHARAFYFVAAYDKIAKLVELPPAFSG